MAEVVRGQLTVFGQTDTNHNREYNFETMKANLARLIHPVRKRDDKADHKHTKPAKTPVRQ